MNKYFNCVIVFFIILFSSCSSQKSPEPKYDLYEVNVKTYLYIRTEPSVDSDLLGWFSNGDLVSVISVSDGWAKIYYEDSEGYVSADYITLVRNNVSQEDIRNFITQHNEVSVLEPLEIQRMNDTTNHVDESIASVNNVKFIGDSSILTTAQRIDIEGKLNDYKEYFFVISTVENVETDELFDFAPDLLDDLSVDMDSGLSWWQIFISAYTGNIPSSHLILLSYIKNKRLLQVESKGNSLKYLRISKPNRYFTIQEEAQKNLPDAITKLAYEISQSGIEFESRNWFIKSQVKSCNILDNICDDVLVENILPNNSFLHKWIFSWVFTIPFAFANFVFSITSSFVLSILFFMIIIIILQLYIVNKLFNKQIFVALIMKFVKFITWLCMISLIVYMIPDMTNICVMENSGFSNSVINCAIEEYANYNISKNWFLVLVFILGTLVVTGIDRDFVVFSTLTSEKQHYFLSMFKDKLESSDSNFNYEEYSKSEQPFLDLSIDRFSKGLGGNIIAKALPLSFVFSGTFLLYASVFLWTKSLNKIIYIIKGIVVYKRM